MKSKLNTNYIIVLVVLAVTMHLFCCTHSQKKSNLPVAKKGVLDITGWDFEKDGPIKLEGEWEFYWNQLLTYNDFHTGNKNLQPTKYSNVPEVWNNYKIGNQKIEGKGYATYRLKVKTNNIDDLKGFKILTESTAYKIMIDRETIATNGTVGKSAGSSVSEYRPQITYFKNDFYEFEVIVQISNYTYARGGFWHSLHFGTFKQIDALKKKSLRTEMLFYGVMISMIIYHIPIYWLQRRNKSILYFVLALCGMSIRILFTGEYSIKTIMPNINYDLLIFIEYMTVYWGATIWFVFIHHVFPEEVSKKNARIYSYISLLITVFIIFSPIYIYTKYLYAIEFYVIIITINILTSLLKAVLHNKQGAILSMLGILLFLMTYAHDSLYYMNMIESSPGGLIGYTTFIMLFIQAYILAERYSKSFEQIEKLSYRMATVNKLKDEFLINTSLELRTPLYHMISITECVLGAMEGHILQKHKNNLTLVILSGKKLISKINGILDYSKLKHGDIELNIDTVDIRPIIDMVIGEQGCLIGNKNITLINDLPLKTIFVYGDKERITQIIYSLVENALKYTRKGYVVIQAIEKNNIVEISVKDTGVGIEEEKLKHIFSSYEYGENSYDDPYRGTGLGLSIAKQLVELQGGAIWVDSKLGKGSKFTFSLLISPPREKTVCEEKITIQSDCNIDYQLFGDLKKSKKDDDFTILVVDDDLVNLHSLVNILSAEEYFVIPELSGINAVDIIHRDHEIDLVILDFMMPQISGYEVCKKIRAQYSVYELPVLMLTSQNKPEAILKGFESGANDFLTKPYETSELRARVKTLLQLRKSAQHAIQSEMAFLQAQIKPHFLYNTLNTIISFCYIDPEKAAELIIELSTYLRNSFDFTNMDKFVSIDKEIELVKAYMSIEKARYGDKINYEYDIDDVSFMIPAFTLQPLVENAVKHGILKNDKKGNIKLSIKEKVDNIIITVQDNGAGIEEQKLRTIVNEEIQGKSVGLKNVIKRLKFLYGYGIEVNSQIQKGTTICIKIPHGRGSHL